MTEAEPVTVVGAGVVGLAVAIAVARAGRQVVLLGDAAAQSASAAAAGMLAPASEAVLDHVSPAVAVAWRAARERWAAWAERFGVALEPRGALHLGEVEALDARQQRAVDLGFEVERRGAGQLLLPEDAVLDPASALAGLARAAVHAGVTLRRGRATLRNGEIMLDGAPVGGGEVVVAAGWGSTGLAEAAPELRALHPIKGQLLRLTAASEPGPVVRSSDAYLVPQGAGWIVGATMEPGRSDFIPDADALARLRAAAVRLRPELAQASGTPAVGVRAATADGAPLVGRSRSGVWLATGLRRNGWLLAPLVAEGIAAYLAGRDPDPALAGQARAWDPARVLPPQGPA